MQIKGVKKAVGDYKRLNAGGQYSPRYGYLMLDRSTGAVWVDEFYAIGHGDFKQYHSTAVINLGNCIHADDKDINMATVRAYAEKLTAAYNGD